LGQEIKITEDGSAGTIFYRAEWNYIFQLPSDFLDIIAQVDERDIQLTYPSKVATAHTWAHIVKGDDDQSYYCSTAHTSVDDANDGKPTGNDGDGNWTLFNADDAYGADWEETKAYLASSNLKLLLSDHKTNSDGDGGYIEYLAYSATGVGDIPTAYDKHFIKAFTTLLASMAAPVSTAKKIRDELRDEYERLSRGQAIARDARPDYEETETSWLDARTE
jgi:hypothetical protein